MKDINLIFIFAVSLLIGLFFTAVLLDNNDKETKEPAPIIKTIGERPTIYPADYCG